MNEEHYKIGNINLINVRNVNEVKVIKMMKQVLPDYPKFDNCTLCFQDIYALSVSKVTPRYVQAGTIMLKKSDDETKIEQIVRSAFEMVIKQPNHP